MPTRTHIGNLDNCIGLLAEWIEQRHRYFLVWRRQMMRDTPLAILLGRGLKLGSGVNGPIDPGKFTWANVLLALRLKVDETVWVQENGAYGLSTKEKQETMKRIIQAWLHASTVVEFSCFDVLAFTVRSGSMHSSNLPFFPDPYSAEEDTVSLWTLPPVHLVLTKLFLRLIHSEYP